MLLSIIALLQIVYFLVGDTASDAPSPQKKEWEALQRQLDTLKPQQEHQSFSLKPFNPNFLSDFRAYKLGMTPAEFNKLAAFRKQGNFVNSAIDFQAITGISDSLLTAIAPYFKFPDWVNSKKNNVYHNTDTIPKKKWIQFPPKETLPILDLNKATKEDLIKIDGIGEAIAQRILNQKEMYGGFVSMDQLTEIWGLSPQVLVELHKYFIISQLPPLKKININNATVKELSQFIYFKYPLSKNIVTYRSMNGDIKLEDLSKIKGFPVDKIKIIALYLEF